MASTGNGHSLQYPALSICPPSTGSLRKNFPVPAFTELPDSDDEATSKTSEDIQKRSMKHKIVRSPFQNVSLMIWLGKSQLVEDFLRAVGLQTQREKSLGKDARITFFRRRHEASWATSARGKGTSFTAEMPAGSSVKLGAPQYDPRVWRLFIDSCKRFFEVCAPPQREPVRLKSLLRTPQLSKRNMKQ
ncbi:hypothetical protein GWK47_036694 [Chionoecetes opilio]|uniref:Uncharacterized protein n=1 Tax=Chionoecetes opilio TaxID=41210 RepID=A0A8J5D2L2_CHIOP|nr:hypothetical protein GWK47_036694 [Chionoecetes opilio]